MTEIRGIPERKESPEKAFRKCDAVNKPGELFADSVGECLLTECEILDSGRAKGKAAEQKQLAHRRNS